MPTQPSIPLVRPALVPWDQIEPHFAKVWQSGQLTIGKCTREFESAMCETAGTKHAIALSSCTSGMMLLLRALDIKGEVIVPSFTWASTGHALVWNQITPVFADCRPDDFTIDVSDVAKKITPQTSAILASNVFGVQPDMDALQALADKHNLVLLCDAAQAIGATYKGRPAGSTALAEVFSLSPTKVITAIEGGIITTNDDGLATRLKQMRDYGKSEDGADVEFFGLSARISELHSVVGTQNLKHVKDWIADREKIANAYRTGLSNIPEISFQTIPKDRQSSFNYFVIQLDAPQKVYEQMLKQGIQTKRYFYPPVHLQTSYQSLPIAQVTLPVTERLSAQCLALPLFWGLSNKQVQQVITTLTNVVQSLR
jgi:dTDP-4-amino-4,6-dideoxygalactose transaminase